MARMRRTEYFKVILSCLVVFWFICFQGLHAADTLTVGQTMRDWEFLESPNKLFRLQFCGLGVSYGRYLGIQYMNDRLVPAKFVWVANSRIPLADTSGTLNITVDGNLVLTDSNGTFITISVGQPAPSSNISATLLDSGNLVLRSGERQPQYRLLTSFASQRLATPGTFIFGVDPNNTKQLVIWQRGVLYWRSGIWNGYNFNYFPYSKFDFSYFSNESDSYFTYTINDNNLSSWIEMGSSGNIRIVEMTSDGLLSFTDTHCGVTDKLEYGTAAGCAVIETSNCKSGDVFDQTRGEMNSWNFLNNFSLGIADCKEICRRNCSCNAYGSASSNGSGCKFSDGQKLNFSEEAFYIRNGSVVATGKPYSH
ncbi:hypothetical protein Acr_00g0071360 [Actinidia rufa]|uniref:Bulb-type lectin domain-containing protein n=1 Tax=Actinidia rufa TaxID=165716 RepID=A0A7J0DRN6_9ERIC|nr:hypothetical protein Acr_00g0071360 [Actinidia rufa]